jgi:hypothetical protein
MLPIKPGLFRLNRKFFAFELSASKWLLVQVKAGGHPKAIWAVTNPWLIMHLFWGIIHDNSSTILFFSGVIMTHYGNFYQLDRGCWTLLAGDKHAQSKTRSIFPTICGWWISRGSQGFSRCRRWWRSLPTSWCSCAFWDSWCILGAFLVHSWCIQMPKSQKGWLAPAVQHGFSPSKIFQGLIQYMEVHPRVDLIARTVKAASGDMFHFCLIFLSTGLQANPQFRNISKPCIAQPIASCPKALELDHFTFRSVWFCGTKVVQADIHRIGLAGTLVIRPRQAPWHWQRDAGSTSEYEKSSHNVAYCDTWWSWLSFCGMSECRLLNQLTTGTHLFYPWPILINHN